jgi:hypothetical protein
MGFVVSIHVPLEYRIYELLFESPQTEQNELLLHDKQPPGHVSHEEVNKLKYCPLPKQEVHIA